MRAALGRQHVAALPHLFRSRISCTSLKRSNPAHCCGASVGPRPDAGSSMAGEDAAAAPPPPPASRAACRARRAQRRGARRYGPGCQAHTRRWRARELKAGTPWAPFINATAQGRRLRPNCVVRPAESRPVQASVAACAPARREHRRARAPAGKSAVLPPCRVARCRRGFRQPRCATCQTSCTKSARPQRLKWSRRA